MTLFKDRTFSAAIAPRESAGPNTTYLNPSKLSPDRGTCRFHILGEPITGWELWIDKAEGGSVPRRIPAEPDPTLIAELEADVGGKLRRYENDRPAIAPFAAFFVYHFDPVDAEPGIRVFSSSQKIILRELDRLTSDPDYADLSTWDIQITRTGKGLETKYAVDMKPTKAAGSTGTLIQAEFKAALAKGADLEALFTGGNPLPA